MTPPPSPSESAAAGRTTLTARLQAIQVPALLGGGRPRLTAQQRARLEMLALSAKAAALAARMETLYENRCRPDFRQEEFDTTDAEIRKVVSALENMARGEGMADPQNLTVALAVADNSIGRALHLKGCYADAMRCFRMALHRVPSMPDPYVGIAAALLRLREGAGPDWRERAAQAIGRALELSPRNGKAYYYKARLSMLDGDFAGALLDLDKADVHPWMLFQKAKLLARHVPESKPDRVLELLAASISMLPRPDERYLLYGEVVLEHRGGVDPRFLRRARELVAEVAGCAADGEARAAGAKLLKQLDPPESKEPPAP